MARILSFLKYNPKSTILTPGKISMRKNVKCSLKITTLVRQRTLTCRHRQSAHLLRLVAARSPNRTSRSEPVVTCHHSPACNHVSQRNNYSTDPSSVHHLRQSKRAPR